MTQPLDPETHTALYEATEYSWGIGMFPPGIANNEGQLKQQDDFGANLPGNKEGAGDKRDNYARAVADRRTDPTDPESSRDFTALGNVDRYGAAPPLVEAEPQPNTPTYSDFKLNETPRAR